MSKYGIFTEENDSEYYFQIVKPSNGEKKEIITIEKLDMRYPPKFQIEGILKEGLGDLLIFIPFPF
ncbi:hypothetical protein [Cyanobacterium aponinum]|uniref:Uncharacterized protein n=1 Tax=Cyanobacterium aponinum (strain PCC 10605) TaxID=755178 RepID=K9Z8P6_CYAAP|nr:hypothetical protein [Cyanobacterium aponinum]AFZ55566.1 hypothetical protein Cyan10605_3533 [Cyanobacterium aponinum PCC 10605]